MTQFESFAGYFIKRFKYRRPTMRRIGIEKEVLAIDGSGNMADLSSTVWPAVKDSGKYRMLYDEYYKNAITGFELGKEIVTTDAGLGTFEFILPPVKTIHMADRKLKNIYRAISPFLRKFGFKMLGLGYQPFTEENPNFWNKKQRYEVLKMVYGKNVDAACHSASDQVHIDIAPDEILKATYAFNKANGFLLTIFGDTILREGRLLKDRAYREIIWDRLGKSRTGILPREFSSVEEYLRHIWDLKFIMAKSGNKFFSPGVPFGEFIKGRTQKETRRQYAYHEGTVWFSSRPRLYGTLEIRPCGLQPFSAHLSVATFCLGLMENLGSFADMLKNFSWSVCRALRYEASKKGFGAKINGKSVLPYIKELAAISHDGLKKRGKGEEKYIAPVLARILLRKNPADEAAEAFKRGGLKELLKSRSFIV